MISNRPANLRCLRIAAVLAVAIGVRAGAQSPSDSLCIFSGPERSTIAWESAARSSSGGSVIGHVVLLHNLQPVPSARVTLEPGAFLTMTDRAGRFQLGGAPNGRYLIRVRALGRERLRTQLPLAPMVSSYWQPSPNPRATLGSRVPLAQPRRGGHLARAETANGCYLMCARVARTLG